MKSMKITLSTVAMSALVAGSAAAATTQSIVVPAGERMLADHKPLGIKAGGFLIIPKVDLEETYDDNIYATENNTKDDMITTVRPTVTAQSNWNRHELNAIVSGEFNRFADHSSEDQDNFVVGADGRLDIVRDTSIGGGASFTRNHEDRGDPNTPATAVEPTEYDTTTARIGAYRGLGKLNARVDSEVKKYDYKNGVTTGGALVDNNLRDRNEYTQSARIGYKLDPRFEIFTRGSVDSRVYDRKGGATLNRSNHGESLVAGSAFDITGKTKGEAYAGVESRDYVDNALKDISEPTWGGKVTWNASDLTSVIGSIDRTIEETSIGTSSGYVATSYKADIQHALTRSLLLNGVIGYAENEYKGRTGTQRDDNIWSAGAGADYYIGRCLKAGVQYVYTDRESNIVNGDYSRNTLMVRLTGTY